MRAATLAGETGGLNRVVGNDVEHLQETSASVRNAADGRDPRTATIGPKEMKERLELLDRLVRIQRELARKQ